MSKKQKMVIDNDEFKRPMIIHDDELKKKVKKKILEIIINKQKTIIIDKVLQITITHENVEVFYYKSDQALTIEVKKENEFLDLEIRDCLKNLIYNLKIDSSFQLSLHSAKDLLHNVMITEPFEIVVNDQLKPFTIDNDLLSMGLMEFKERLSRESLVVFEHGTCVFVKPSENRNELITKAIHILTLSSTTHGSIISVPEQFHVNHGPLFIMYDWKDTDIINLISKTTVPIFSKQEWDYIYYSKPKICLDEEDKAQKMACQARRLDFNLKHVVAIYNNGECWTHDHFIQKNKFI